MRPLALVLLLIAATAAGQSSQTFSGAITDSVCADANHSRMRMGETDAECATACVEAHDAMFVLYDGKVAFELSDQKAAAPYAGKKVTVSGTLDAKSNTIRVQSIAPAR
jgi:hypothetical protein